MNKKYCLFVVLLFFVSSIYAQPYTVPVAEQPAYFVFAEAGRSDNRLKVVFISTHIIRMKNSVMPAIDVDINLDFEKLVKDIPYNEKYYSEDPKNIAIWKVEHEDIYGNSLKWNLAWKHYEKVETSDNTVMALEKIRESLIRDYQSKGFKIYQIDFNPDLSGAYRYLNKSVGKYENWKMERLSPLSPLWIPYYKRGEIKNLLADLNTNVTQGGGFLTVEDKDKTETKISNNNNTPTQKKVDNTDYAALAAVKRMEAEAYEAEGDRLYKLGTLFMLQALQQYQLAQQAMPSPRVEQKINGINAQIAAAQAINKGLEKLDDASEELRNTVDQTGLPRFRAAQFSYSGLMHQSANPKFPGSTPWNGAITYGFYRILAIEAGVYYGQSPVYSLFLTDNNGNKVGQTIQAQTSHGGLTMSAGFAYPIKSLVVYAMYGWNLSMGNASAKLLTAGYSYPDVKDDIQSFKWRPIPKFGFHLRIPKSRIALGAHYTFNTVKGETLIDPDSPYTSVSQGSTKYKVGGSEIAKYKFSQLGFSFMILSKRH